MTEQTHSLTKQHSTCQWLWRNIATQLRILNDLQQGEIRERNVCYLLKSAQVRRPLSSQKVAGKSNMNLDVVRRNRIYFSVVCAATKKTLQQAGPPSHFNLCDTRWMSSFQQLEEKRRAEILAFPFTRFQPTAYNFLVLRKLLKCSCQRQHRLEN